MTTDHSEGNGSAEREALSAVAAEAERDSERWRERIDLEALLAALVLVPHAYPRNRFFSLYRVPEARVVRRRAARLRSVVTDLASLAHDVALSREGEEVRLSYRLDDLGARRSVVLDDTELALVTAALQRKDSARGRLLADFEPQATSRVAPLLERLLHHPKLDEADGGHETL